MSWRTVLISNQCKLDYRMGYLVVRGEDVKRIFLDEMAILVIENPAVSLTGCLIEALTEKQFSQMEYIVGESHSEVIDSDERLIIL